MGDVHNELRRGPLSSALANALGDSRGGGIERYGETLTPVLDLWSMPEWAFLREEGLVQFGTIVSAVAAEFGYNGVLNPAGSGFLVVVDALQIEGAGSYNLRFRITDTPTVQTGVIRADMRWSATVVSTSQYISGAEPAATGANMTRFSLPAAATVLPEWLPVGVILPPGTNVVVEHGTVNTAFTANWRWRERRAMPTELGLR